MHCFLLFIFLITSTLFFCFLLCAIFLICFVHQSPLSPAIGKERGWNQSNRFLGEKQSLAYGPLEENCVAVVIVVVIDVFDEIIKTFFKRKKIYLSTRNYL